MKNSISVAMGEKVSLRTNLSYSIGCIGRDANYTFFSTFLMTYLTWAVGLIDWQLAVVGVVISVARIWDGINDPLMGVILDNTKPKNRWGKFKPFIIIGGISNAISTILLFSGIVDPDKNWILFIVIFAFSYLLWDITFTMNDIGYWGMLPNLTTDPKERERTSSLARIGANIGLFAVQAIIPLVSTMGSLPLVYRYVSIVIAAVFVLCQFLIIWGVKEQSNKITETDGKVNFKEAMKIIFKNDQLAAMIVTILLFNIGYFTTTGFGLHFFYFDYGVFKGSEFTIFALTIGISQIVTLAFAARLTKHFTRRQLFSMSIVLVVVGYLGFMGVGYILPMNMITLCAIGFILFSGQAMIQFLNYVMLADTVEYGQWKFGKRNEGIVFSLNPLINKFASAAQALIFTITMLVSGLNYYNKQISILEKNSALSNEEIIRKGNELVSQIPNSMNLLMRVFMLALPLALILLSYIVYLKKYTLDEKRYAEIMQDLQERAN